MSNFPVYGDLVVSNIFYKENPFLPALPQAWKDDCQHYLLNMPLPDSLFFSAFSYAHDVTSLFKNNIPSASVSDVIFMHQDWCHILFNKWESYSEFTDYVLSKKTYDLWLSYALNLTLPTDDAWDHLYETRIYGSADQQFSLLGKYNDDPIKTFNIFRTLSHMVDYKTGNSLLLETIKRPEHHGLAKRLAQECNITSPEASRALSDAKTSYKTSDISKIYESRMNLNPRSGSIVKKTEFKYKSFVNWLSNYKSLLDPPE